MATSQLKLTRDQLATFLKDHEQIRQFEQLFVAASGLLPTTLQDLAITAGNADQKSVEALDVASSLAQQAAIDSGNADQKAVRALDAVSTLAQQAAIDIGNADQKAVQALDALNRIANALEMLAAAPVIEKNNSVVTDYVDHNVGAPLPEAVPGRVYWSDDDATLDLHLEGGVTYQFGQQLDFHPKNTSGVQIDKGMAVMSTGVVGASTKIECARAVADGSVPAQYMLGIATQDIPNNEFGYVAWFGSVRGFNTTGANKTVPEVWADGDVLYFDPVYPGELTKVQPVAPNLDLPIAIITNAANNGAIFVRMKTGETINELHDVDAPSPSNNDLLVYNTVNSRWEAGNAVVADLTNNTGNLIDSSVGLTNGAGANTATLTNSPATGNPTKWVPIDDNGTTRYIPCW